MAFPFPLAEVDIPGNNRYLAGLAREKGICGLMSVRPEWSSEYCEETLLEIPLQDLSLSLSGFTDQGRRYKHL